MCFAHIIIIFCNLAWVQIEIVDHIINYFFKYKVLEVLEKKLCLVIVINIYQSRLNVCWIYQQYYDVIDLTIKGFQIGNFKDIFE